MHRPSPQKPFGCPPKRTRKCSVDPKVSKLHRPSSKTCFGSVPEYPKVPKLHRPSYKLLFRIRFKRLESEQMAPKHACETIFGAPEVAGALQEHLLCVCADKSFASHSAPDQACEIDFCGARSGWLELSRSTFCAFVPINRSLFIARQIRVAKSFLGAGSGWSSPGTLFVRLCR